MQDTNGSVREEAQPVAWVDPYVLERLEDNLGGRIYPRRGISGARQPLYATPPALAAEKLRLRLIEKLCGDETFRVNTCGDHCGLAEDIVDLLLSELRALQQEGT